MDPDNTDRLQWLIEGRHSTRAPFDPAQTVSERELARIVDAARWAPTAHNMQNFRLVAIDDRAVLDELGRIRSDKIFAEVIAGAPLVIVVLYDPTQPAPGEHGLDDAMISLGCVLENMWLTAQACHLDVQVASTFASPGAEPEVKRVLGVPAPWRIAFALRVGHAVATRDQLRVRRDPEMFVHRNHF